MPIQKIYLPSEPTKLLQSYITNLPAKNKQEILNECDITEKTLKNYCKTRTPIPLATLEKLSHLTKIDLTSLLNVNFSGQFFTENAQDEIKLKLKEYDLTEEKCAAELNVEEAHFKNWILAYTAIEPTNANNIAIKLQLQANPLTELNTWHEPTRSNSLDALVNNARTVKNWLSLAIISTDPSQLHNFSTFNISRAKIEELFQRLPIPEKHFQVFYHDARKNKNFYQEILIENQAHQQQTVKYIFTFLANGAPVDYGDVLASETHTRANNYFTHHEDAADNIKEQPIKVGTWLGEGNCWFVIRSTLPFELKLNRQLTELEALSEKGLVLFLR